MTTTNPVETGEFPWLVWSNEHRAFWAPNRQGYTGRIEKAGRYTKAEAETICSGANYRTNSTIYEGTPPEICMPAPEALEARHRLGHSPRDTGDARELLRQAMNTLGTCQNNDPLEPIADNGMTVWDGMKLESDRLWNMYRALSLPRQSADGEVLTAAVKPWSDFHGDLPDYDHPLRCVYESGIQYAVNLLAKELGVKRYEICDGTEEFDGDLGGTMMNIVMAALPQDEHGDPLLPSEICERWQPTTPEVERLREGLDLARNRLRAHAVNSIASGDKRATEHSRWAAEADAALNVREGGE